MGPRHFRRLGFSVCFLVCVMGWAMAENSFSISAPAFAPGRPMPARYAHALQNISPELRIENIPPKTRSLALIVDDPDAPVGLWTHWLVWNLPPDTTSLPEGGLPPQAVEGKNSNGHVRYDGPAPPAGTGTHRYFFHLYALDAVLSLTAGGNRAALLAAMKGHVIGQAQTFGTYRYGQALPEE